jgi:hypothetical protein
VDLIAPAADARRTLEALMTVIRQGDASLSGE